MIYGEGKSLEQIQGIVLNMKKNEVENILLTRVSSETYDLVKKIYPNAVYYSSCRLIVIEENPFSKNKGIITIFSGGTTDIPVCEEAAITAEFLGNRIERVYDVGVRLHDEVARIEVINDEINRFFDYDLIQRVVKELKKVGFSYVCLDLEGYRMGSMNNRVSLNDK